MEDSDFSSEGIILVLGVTGAGKSYFLNQLKNHSAVEGHTIHSETTQCHAVQIFLDDEESRSVTVVDTPGFDDTKRPPGEVLAEITQFLATQHTLGVPLRGVLYLHKIIDNKMTGSSQRYLTLLESLVGEQALQNLIFVTTMWNKLRDEDKGDGLRREQELIDDFWAPMEQKGAYVMQYDGTSRAAYSLVFQLAGKESVVLNVQKEIVDQNRTILDTSAGTNLLHQLEDDAQGDRQELIQLKAEIKSEQMKELPNKRRLHYLQDRKADVDRRLKEFDASVDHMKTQPGPGIRQKLRDLRSKGSEAWGSAALILARVLSLTVLIVNISLSAM